jgi:hypothetical protein
MKEEFPDQKKRLAVCYSLWDKDEKNLDMEGGMGAENIERRYFDLNNSEIRVVRKEGEPTKIVGYFAKFDNFSKTIPSWLGSFREIIEPGFFEDALKRSDFNPADLWNHNSDFILGRVSSGTLRVWEDDTGLGYECTPPDTQLVRDMVLTPIERGDVAGCSFGFRVKKNGDIWDEDEEGRMIRTLKKGGCSELIEGSQCAFPAYPDTDCALRSMDKWKKEVDEAAELKAKEEQEKRDKEQKEQEEQQRKENEAKEAQKAQLDLLKKKLDLKEKEI